MHCHKDKSRAVLFLNISDCWGHTLLKTLPFNYYYFRMLARLAFFSQYIISVHRGHQTKQPEVNKGQEGLLLQMEWTVLIRGIIFWTGRGKWKQGEIERGLDYRLMSAALRPYHHLWWQIGCNQEWQLNGSYLGYFYWGGTREAQGGVIEQTVVRCCAETQQHVTECVSMGEAGISFFVSHAV